MAHVHYFTVSIYLAIRRAAKLGIFTHFMFTNLPRCSQSMKSLIYRLYRSLTAFYECLITAVVITLLHTTATKTIFLYYALRGVGKNIKN